jgi:uncharacterized protein YbjT (DUF2867 family)
MWKIMVSKPLHLVAVKDVGHFAAEALLHPDDWANKTISLAGDHITFADADKIFKQKIGKKIPQIPRIAAYAFMLAVPELKVMFKWFASDSGGYEVEVESLRKSHPGLLTWSNWVEQESKFKTANES